MRKIFILSATCILMMLSENTAMGYHFYTYHNGKTIYFNILSPQPAHNAEVTFYTTGVYVYNGHVDIPDTVRYNGELYNVIGIGNNAFAHCTGLTSVTLPLSVTTIGDNAFYNCTGLTSITLPDSTGFTSVTISPSVKRIGRFAFYNCHEITTLTISNASATIGSQAFVQCSKLTTVSLGDSLKAIGDSAFFYCPMATSLIIPNTVDSIGNSAFYHCDSLVTVYIGHAVKSIGTAAFAACHQLTTVDFHAENCTNMGNNSTMVFYGCPLFTTLYIGNQVKFIPERAFFNSTSLNSVNIPSSVKGIGNSAFRDCYQLVSVIFSDSVKNIGMSAFRNCSQLTAVTLPSSVTVIEDFAFSGCTEMRALSISDSLMYIGNSVFSHCSKLDSVIIPNAIKTIGNDAFTNCTGLIFLKMSDSLTNIGNSAFSHCSKLTAITFPHSLKTMGKGVFTSCAALTSIIIPDGVTMVGNSLFYECTGLISATIGNSITNIPEYMFYNCNSLTSIFISPSVKNIGTAAFSRCSSLTAMDIPGSVTNIGNTAFRYCSRLDSVTIHSGVQTIRAYAFSNCNALTFVKIGNTVTLMEDHAFSFTDIRELRIEAMNPPQIFAGTFEGVFNAVPVYVPCGRSGNYKKANHWSYFYNILDDNTFFNITLTYSSQMGVISFLQAPCNDNIAIIEATPNPGYKFIKWKDNVTDNPRTIILTSDTTFEALFEILHYRITLWANDSLMGEVSSSGLIGGGVYEANVELSLFANPKPDYYFVKWNDGNTDNPRNILLTGDTVFTAEFAFDRKNRFQAFVYAHNPAMGTVTGAGYYEKNTDIIITATANPNHRFVCWNDGNTQTPRTVTLINDTIFIASFEATTAVVDIEIPSLTLYPNPFKDAITVILPENVPQAIFTLYDIQGKVLILQTIHNQKTFSFDNLAQGIYIYNVTAEGKRYQGKIVCE